MQCMYPMKKYLTCSICSVVAKPKCRTVPSTGDTRQLTFDIVLASGRNCLVKNSDILR